MIGYDEHGRWALRPTIGVNKVNQRYRENTLILETDVSCDSGVVRRIEFMPIAPEHGARCDVIRIIEGLEGKVPMEMLLDVGFGYGIHPPWIAPAAKGFAMVAGPDRVVVHGTTKMEPHERGIYSYFTLKKGERVAFHLIWSPSHLKLASTLDAESELKHTDQFWKQWAGRCNYEGRWHDAVLRSLITLKALIYAPTGSIVAAPTTSLPEALGGVRNWDYRFCWLRDASLTLQALMVGGYVGEAASFRDWLLRAIAGDPSQIQIMYNIDGGRRLTEFEIAALPGYEDSRPVRIGNAASEQFQLDVFGEVLNTIYLAREMGMPPAENASDIVKPLINHLTKVWQYPDSGIWEVRGGKRHFTHSKVMAWVAIDRAIRFLQKFWKGMAFNADAVSHLSALRERIHEEVCQRGFHPEVKAFTQYYGAEVLDASALLIPHFGFLPPNDLRVLSTVEAIERNLVRDGFVLRYENAKSDDGLPGSEGTFLACSFWLADNYAMTGQIERAEELFEQILSVRNPLGLLAEEYNPTSRRQLGNFPQAFSHLALVSTANLLNRKMGAEKKQPRFNTSEIGRTISKQAKNRSQ